MVAGHHVCIVSFSCMVLGREDWIILNLFYVCCHALTSWQYAFVAESSSCIHSSGWTCRPDLSLQWNLLHRFTVVLQIECAVSCSGPGDGSLLVPPSLSNVSRPGPSDILLVLCCTLLYFLCYLLRLMAIKSIQLQLQAPHSIIQYIRYISLLPYWSYCLCGLSC